MGAIYRDSAPSFSTVKFGAAEFKRSRTSLVNDELSSQSKTTTTTKSIVNVYQIVLDDRPLVPGLHNQDQKHLREHF